jgi:hypothetical protein
MVALLAVWKADQWVDQSVVWLVGEKAGLLVGGLVDQLGEK